MKNKIIILLAVASLFVACSKKNKAAQNQGVTTTRNTLNPYTQNTGFNPINQNNTGRQNIGGVVWDMATRTPLYKCSSLSFQVGMGLSRYSSYKMKEGNCRTCKQYFRTEAERCLVLKDNERNQACAQEQRRRTYYGYSCDKKNGLFPGDTVRPGTSVNPNDDVPSNDDDVVVTNDVKRAITIIKSEITDRNSEEVAVRAKVKIATNVHAQVVEGEIDCERSILTVAKEDFIIPGDLELDVNKKCSEMLGKMNELGVEPVPTDKGTNTLTDTFVHVTMLGSDVVKVEKESIVSAVRVNRKGKIKNKKVEGEKIETFL